ncbi:MAG: hypothetical protein PVJ03_11965 [Chromatiaceae bacterium]|jgi:hypothetical protein
MTHSLFNWALLDVEAQTSPAIRVITLVVARDPNPGPVEEC